MQKEIKNIDKLFHNASKEFEKEPPLYAWDKLKSDLDKKEKKRKIAFIYRIAASILIIISIFGGGYYISKHSVNKNNYLVSNKILQLNNKNDLFNKQPQIISNKNKTNTDTIINSRLNQFNKKNHSNILNTNYFNSTILESKPSLKSNENKKENNKNIFIKKTDNIENDSTYTALNKNKDTLIEDNNISVKNETALSQNIKNNKFIADTFTKNNFVNINDKPIIITDVKSSKWSIEGQVVPTYSTGKISGSTITAKNNNGNPTLTYSGGLKVDYSNINEKFGIETGVLYSDIGMGNTYAMIYVDKASLINNNNYNYGGSGFSNFSPPNLAVTEPNLTFHIETSTGNVQLNSNDFTFTDLASAQNITQDTNHIIYHANYSIIQKYEFIEIPLIIKYKIINKKIGVNILGGIGTGYLIGNNLYIEKDNKKYNIGENKNIEKFIYNGILGVSLKYFILKKISMNIEPDFKYALKPINKNYASKYVPYSISLSMGICYDFK